MAKHLKTGQEGEIHARRYLEENGYEIRYANWQLRKFEIDLIAQKDDLLIIVEVKTRSTNYAGHPSEAVTPKKQRQLIAAANAYIDQTECDLEVRFDVITVLGKGPDPILEHFEDAFFPQA